MKILFASKTSGPHDKRFKEAISSFGHQVEHLQFCSFDTPSGSSAKYRTDGSNLSSIWDLIKEEFDPSLVHAGPIQEVAYPLSAVVDVPIIPMSWGSDLLHISEDSDRKRIATRLLSRSRYIFVDSIVVEEKARDLGFQGKAFCFPWGIELEPYRAMEINRGVTTTFLSIRNWEAIYDVETICRAYDLVAPQLPDSKLILCGQGSQEPELRKALSAVPDKQLDWRGYLNESKLTATFEEADYYLSSSLSDGSSISLLQALASGKPVIVSKIPGNEEWVEAGVNGWTFPCGDFKALANAMLKSYALDSAAYLTIAKSNRRIAEVRANWNLNSAIIDQAYSEVIRDI